MPLEKLLDAARPYLQLAGLVSSLLGWFHDQSDCPVLRRRILPAIEYSGYAPVLIYPDDLDFYIFLVPFTKNGCGVRSRFYCQNAGI